MCGKIEAHPEIAIHLRDLGLLSFLDERGEASDYGDPMNLLGAAAVLAPEDADIRFWHGYVSEIRDHASAFAASLYEKVLKLNPDHVYALKVSSSDFELPVRIERLQRCVELQPNDLGVLKRLADAYIESGEVSAAEDVLQRVLEVEPFEETRFGFMNEYVNDVFTLFNRVDEVRSWAREQLDELG